MDIRIIIGLLITLIIVYATMMKISALRKENILLKKRWKNRTICIEDIIFYVFRLDDFTNRFGKLKQLSDEDKSTLFHLKDSIKGIIKSVKDYERRSF